MEVGRPSIDARAIPHPLQPSAKGKVMRARLRHVIPTAVFAAAIALSAIIAPVTTSVQAGLVCPAGTAWDNRLQRCV